MVREWPDSRHVYYGTAAERAAFPAAGEAAGALFFDYDDERWYYWDGAAWQTIAPGWGLNIIRVDGIAPGADYASLETAFATEPDGTFFTIGGPGIYTLTASPLPDTSFLHSYGADDLLKVRGYAIGGITYGLPMELNGTIRGIYAEGVHVSNDVGGVRCPNNSAAQLDHCILHANGAFVPANAYALDIGTNAEIWVYGGKLLAELATNNYGARVGAGSILHLYDLPIIEATTFFTGAGTITGVFQDANGRIWTVNGAAGTERLINSYLQASDGAPDPAWSVGATGNLAAAGAYSLDVNAGEIILDADADTSITADTDDQIDFRASAGDRMSLTAAGLAMAAGARVDEFSTDGTLGGNSDTALPTEKAVKTYVDKTYTDWTPTVDQGGAVNVTVDEAKYALIGKICHVQAKLTVTGAGTGGNSIIIGGQPAAIQPALTSGAPAGTGIVVDTGTASYPGILSIVGATTWYIIDAGTRNYVGLNPNIALGNTDVILFSAVYRVA